MSIPFEDRLVIYKQTVGNVDVGWRVEYFTISRTTRVPIDRFDAEAKVARGEATLIKKHPGNQNPKPKGPRPATLIKRADEARRKAEFRKQLATQKEARVQARRAARLLEE